MLTSTVTLEGETQLVVDSILPIELRGEPRIREILISVEATITASTSTRARRLAEDLTVEEARPDPSTIALLLLAPKDASLAGAIRVRLPADMNVRAIGRGGPLLIERIDGALDVTAVSHVRVIEAARDVKVSLGFGNALVDAELAPGSNVDIRVRTGDIELRVPEALSANIEATFTTEGAILTDHARLPPFFGAAGQPYRASVGGGLSVVRLATGSGRIVIRSR